MIFHIQVRKVYYLYRCQTTPTSLKQELCAAKVDVICRTESGFQVLPKRWRTRLNVLSVGGINTVG